MHTLRFVYMEKSPDRLGARDRAEALTGKQSGRGKRKLKNLKIDL